MYVATRKLTLEHSHSQQYLIAFTTESSIYPRMFRYCPRTHIQSAPRSSPPGRKCEGYYQRADYYTTCRGGGRASLLAILCSRARNLLHPLLDMLCGLSPHIRNAGKSHGGAGFRPCAERVVQNDYQAPVLYGPRPKEHALQG